MEIEFPPDWQRILVERDGRWNERAAVSSSLLLPGSFHPLHAGHLGLAGVAEEMLGTPVAFEISLVNVDKAKLPLEDALRRVTQFAGFADVWLTQASRFVEKARLFPGVTFVLGADTAARLVDARYYNQDTQAMLGAHREMAELGCRFLVAARADGMGRCLTLADLPVPAAFADRFQAIPVERFRLDVSSTQIRAGQG